MGRWACRFGGGSGGLLPEKRKKNSERKQRTCWETTNKDKVPQELSEYLWMM